MANYLSFDKCEDGCLYVLQARNASLGIFDKLLGTFAISRFKFGGNRLDSEEHWDLGGTAKPLEKVEVVPTLNSSSEVLTYLNTHPSAAYARQKAGEAMATHIKENYHTP